MFPQCSLLAAILCSPVSEVFPVTFPGSYNFVQGSYGAWLSIGHMGGNPQEAHQINKRNRGEPMFTTDNWKFIDNPQSETHGKIQS